MGRAAGRPGLRADTVNARERLVRQFAEVTNDPRFTDDGSSAHPAQQAAVWLATYVLWLDTEPIQAAPPT